MINNVSFSGKIPVYRFGVRNSLREENTNATLYEYDCKDADDIKEVSSTTDFFLFDKQIINSMSIKNMYYSSIEYFTPDIAQKYAKDKPRSSFYLAKADNDEVLGICAVYDNEYGKKIRYLETRADNKYKYIGRGIIASVANEVLKDGEDVLEVAKVPASTFKFYTEKCGFETDKDKQLHMDREKLKEFIKRTEEKTSKRLIDLNA